MARMRLTCHRFVNQYSEQLRWLEIGNPLQYLSWEAREAREAWGGCR